jgi:hypothetical protein
MQLDIARQQSGGSGWSTGGVQKVAMIARQDAMTPTNATLSLDIFLLDGGRDASELRWH